MASNLRRSKRRASQKLDTPAQSQLIPSPVDGNSASPAQMPRSLQRDQSSTPVPTDDASLLIHFAETSRRNSSAQDDLGTHNTVASNASMESYSLGHTIYSTSETSGESEESNSPDVPVVASQSNFEFDLRFIRFFSSARRKLSPKARQLFLTEVMLARENLESRRAKTPELDVPQPEMVTPPSEVPRNVTKRRVSRSSVVTKTRSKPSRTSPRGSVKSVSSTEAVSEEAATTRSRRSSKRSSSDVDTTPPAPKRSKPISQYASDSRDWCKAVKAIPLSDLPDFCPSKADFIERAEHRSTAMSASSRYHGVAGNHDSAGAKQTQLSAPEQKFVAAFCGRLVEAQYVECKMRIFAGHRWRTEEDGIYHNIETSQQLCPIDVKVASTIHKWFDAMGLFDQRWNVQNRTPRPAHLKTLYRVSEGRNGRTTVKKRLNVPERTY